MVSVTCSPHKGRRILFMNATAYLFSPPTSASAAAAPAPATSPADRKNLLLEVSNNNKNQMKKTHFFQVWDCYHELPANCHEISKLSICFQQMEHKPTWKSYVNWHFLLKKVWQPPFWRVVTLWAPGCGP